MTIQSDGLSVARRQLGVELKTLCERAELTAWQVAAVMRTTSHTIRRWGRGESAPRFSELERMFELCGMADRDHRLVLCELYEQSNGGPVWHSKLRLPEATIGLHGFEWLARTVDLFDLSIIPGPLQIEAYADHVFRRLQPRATDEDIKRQVEQRMARQERVYAIARPPTVRVILTEGALHLVEDDTELMREQIRHLYSGPFGSKLRILRRNVAHAGINGSFTLYGFDSETRPAAVYTEGPIRNVYADDEDSVTQARATFQRLWTTALTEQESSKLLASTLKKL